MAYKKIDLKQHAEDKAKTNLAKFINAWGNKNWITMLTLCQRTWAKDNGIEKLKAFYKDKVLVSAKIGDSVPVGHLNGEVVKDFQVMISYKMPLWSADRKTHKETLVARVICETAPYTADKLGEWGVNPVSTLRKI
jgi:hypothetical protein